MQEQGRQEDFPGIYCNGIHRCYYPTYPGKVSDERDSESFQQVRYYGWYSNRVQGEREKRKPAFVTLPEVPTSIELIDVSEYQPPQNTFSSVTGVHKEGLGG